MHFFSFLSIYMVLAFSGVCVFHLLFPASFAPHPASRMAADWQVWIGAQQAQSLIQ